MDWPEARALFPSVDKIVYLNTAGGGPLSERSAAAGRAYYEQSLADGDIHWDAWLERVEAVRGELARFLNARPANIAFTANASTGLNVAAHMLRGRGRVLAVADEFPSCTLPFLQLGHDVDFVTAAADGALDIDQLEAAASETTAVLAVSFVQYKSGFRNDLECLGAFCRQRGLTFVIDATQGFGAFPIDVAANHADFLSFSAYKWATSGYSIGAVYVSDRFLVPASYPLVGWRSAREPYDLTSDSLDVTPDARALEQGHPPFAGVFALGASLDLVAEIGIDRIAARIVELTRYLHQRLDAAGIGVLSTRDESHQSGITVAAAEDPGDVVRRLRAEGVIVSTRGAGIRVSVHYYNNRADIDQFVAALAATGA
ncbi:MAG: aminotransferase class V-fold PLP-dependent enzyme [Acidobacteria bacterium]|nr:aminotransferase class V-fold PLP-dependent enzyme [Acidobacteriota bacterium]